MIKAEIIADSINQYGNRITSFVITFPRIVLAEFNTHRALSRNSASSRAIPFNKMLELVQKDPFIPIAWMKEHKGMQGDAFFQEGEKNPLLYRDADVVDILKQEWLRARDEAVRHAVNLSKAGLTKQICNRLLEPYMWHTAIVTGTDWENFFALRAHKDAEIHIADLAYKMLEALNVSKPNLLQTGEWHIPFGDKFDEERLVKEAIIFLGANSGWSGAPKPKDIKHYILNYLIQKIAVARCARVSYLNFEGKDDYKSDVTLCNRLAMQGHMSPFEHVAQCMHNDSYYGNFQGWKQYRKIFKEENKKDGRVIRHSINN